MSAKKCRICEKTLPLSAYGNRTASPDGKTTKCKPCINEQVSMVRWLKKNDPKSILLQRESFKTQYPTISNSNFKSWVKRHTEYTSLRGVFGEELYQLVLRFEVRPIQLNMKKRVK
jgi:hypothetical protein